ncbi:MAG: alkaline phosphatase family protein [Acidobacteria bacterium]|nr:alkaline phosphatase family protein [Acidobacteriota bacterium]
MRYLRMLTNAVAGGVLAATYLAALIFQVNPQLPLLSTTAVRWLGAVVAFYAPYLTVLLYFLMLGRDLLSLRPLRPAWLSVRVLAWLGAVMTAGAAALTWANLEIFRTVLSDEAVDRMRAGAWAVTACAAVLAGIVVLRYADRRRGGRPVTALLIAALCGSVAVPLWLRGPGETFVRVPRRSADESHPALRAPRLPLTSAPSVRIIALDGASLGFIRQRVAIGQLPNFGRLLDRGAVVDLATITPTDAEPVWAAAATGKASGKNGIRSRAAYRVTPADPVAADVLPKYCFATALPEQGFVGQAPPTAASLVARPIWDILADYGLASGIAGWPVTYPARADRGYVLSEQFDEATGSPLRLADASAGDPTTAVDVARPVFDRWMSAPWDEVLPALAEGAMAPPGLEGVRWDRAYSDAASELAEQFAPRLTAVRYEGLAEVGRRYLREAQPELFGEPRRVDPQRSPLDQYYEYLDAEVGGALHRLAPGDLLLVVSGFGMEPAGPRARLVARLLGRRDDTGTNERAPAGFLLAYGTAVTHGQPRPGSILDLAPTVLYYMGAEVGRDMDGFARRDLFVSTFQLDHPVKYVATHER